MVGVREDFYDKQNFQWMSQFITEHCKAVHGGRPVSIHECHLVAKPNWTGHD